MMCLSSKPLAEAGADGPATPDSTSQLIDKELKLEKQRLDKEIKLLLLGTGESGKSSVVKQMRLIHSTGFSADERHAWLGAIYDNVVQSVLAVLDFMDRARLRFDQDESRDFAIIMTGLRADEAAGEPRISRHVANAVEGLWSDAGFKRAVARSCEYQLNDSATWFFDQVNRLAERDYTPTDTDILRARSKTTGITEIRAQVGEKVYRIIDVGGQRSERKKWLAAFDGVTALNFIVALPEYAQTLREDPSMNRMTESLLLWTSIIKSRWFRRTSFVFFGNKTDLFQQRFESAPLSDFYPSFADYRPPGTESISDWRRGLLFLRDMFLERNEEKRTIYPHFTCAIDTKQFRRVIDSVNDSLLKNALTDGLL